jgi:hypothetical protein
MRERPKHVYRCTANHVTPNFRLKRTTIRGEKEKYVKICYWPECSKPVTAEPLIKEVF